MTNKLVNIQTVFTPKRKPHKFNKKATWIRQGKKQVIQDYINENSKGLNFYENLEKLGSVQTTIEYMKSKGQEIYGDFSNAITLENLEKKRQALIKIWNRLPYDVRAQFGNNFEIFTTNGGAYFENLKKQWEKGEEHAEETGTDTTPIHSDEGSDKE